MKHVAFFSHSGYEIINLYLKAGIKPDLVVTNRTDLDGVSNDLLQHFDVVQIPNRPTVEDYKAILPDNAFITLHGYMRILPKDITDAYKCFNGHPGLITMYPDLKGKDPQERAYMGDYEFIGGVIHKVNELVDDGEVLLKRKTTSLDKGWDDQMDWHVYNMQRLWKQFFKNKLYV